MLNLPKLINENKSVFHEMWFVGQKIGNLSMQKYRQVTQLPAGTCKHVTKGNTRFMCFRCDVLGFSDVHVHVHGYVIFTICLVQTLCFVINVGSCIGVFE